jgi:hypothetical protein
MSKNERPGLLGISLRFRALVIWVILADPEGGNGLRASDSTCSDELEVWPVSLCISREFHGEVWVDLFQEASEVRVDRPCDAWFGRGVGIAKTRDDEQGSPVMLAIRGDESGLHLYQSSLGFQSLGFGVGNKSAEGDAVIGVHWKGHWNSGLFLPPWVCAAGCCEHGGVEPHWGDLIRIWYQQWAFGSGFWMCPIKSIVGEISMGGCPSCIQGLVWGTSTACECPWLSLDNWQSGACENEFWDQLWAWDKGQVKKSPEVGACDEDQSWTLELLEDAEQNQVEVGSQKMHSFEERCV